jgi:DNA-binding CsgD family transcriptional regulator
VWAAADRLGIDVDAATAAEASGLVTVEGRIRFRHPLVRSAVYHGALLSDRGQVHAALAEVVDGPAAGEHRAWHRAHATTKPDEDVAAELVHSAGLARSRGGVSAAAAFLAYAADLTPDSNRRAERAIDAAQAKLEAGAPRDAWELSVRAEEATDDALLRTRVDLLRAKLAFAASRGNDAPPMLLAAAKRLESLDPILARETYLEALMAAIVAGRLSMGQGDATRTIAAAARHAPSADRTPTSVDLLLDGLVVRLLDGYVSAAPLLRTAIQQFRVEDAAGTADPRWHDITNRVSLDLFDQDTYDSLAARQLELLRADDALTLLPVALTTVAGVHVQTGHFSQAGALLEQAEVIREAIGAPPQRYIEPFLAANRGQEQLTHQLVRASIDCANQRGEGFAISVALYASAILDNSLGHYREALASCQWALQHDDLGMSGYLLVEMVEAAAHCGENELATEALHQLDERAQASATETALGLAARSKALVSEGSEADSEYRSAISYLERAPVALYRARTHLVYGEWLRRRRQRTAARTQLRLAYAMFEPMGARVFAGRARHELETTGEFVSKPEQNAVIALTAQERHITRLAREGYTNPEIGAQLFLSPRTVEWHLGKVFAKLGVTSRRGLRNVPLEPV